MTRPARVRVLHTARVRTWQVATIPFPEPTYHLETAVRLERGPQYIVISDDEGRDMRVYPAYLPRRRPMRQCGRRDSIMLAVARALPMTRPSTGEPT